MCIVTWTKPSAHLPRKTAVTPATQQDKRERKREKQTVRNGKEEGEETETAHKKSYKGKTE